MNVERWSVRKLCARSRRGYGDMALFVAGALWLALAAVMLLAAQRAELRGYAHMNSAAQLDAYLESGLSGGSVAYDGYERLPGALVVTQQRSRSMELSLSYIYLEVPLEPAEERSIYELYRLHGADYEVLLLVRYGDELPASPASLSGRYDEMAAVLRAEHLAGAENGYVFAAGSDSLAFPLGMAGVALALLLIYWARRFAPALCFATPFGRQLALWGERREVARSLDWALERTAFACTSLLAAEEWLVLGARNRPARAPIPLPARAVCMAALLPEAEEDGERTLLIAWRAPKAAAPALWQALLDGEEAERLRLAWDRLYAPLRLYDSRPDFEGGALMIVKDWLLLGARERPTHAVPARDVCAAQLQRTEEDGALLTLQWRAGDEAEPLTWQVWLDGEEAAALCAAWAALRTLPPLSLAPMDGGDEGRP